MKRNPRYIEPRFRWKREDAPTASIEAARSRLKGLIEAWATWNTATGTHDLTDLTMSAYLQGVIDGDQIHHLRREGTYEEER